MMMYNEIVENCFFNPEYAGFDESRFRRILEYFPANTSNKMVFAIGKDAADFSLSLRFKASGNPYVLAAAEWICRQFKKKNFIDCMGMSPEDWHALLEIPVSQKRTALQITQACKQLEAVDNLFHGCKSDEKGEAYE